MTTHAIYKYSIAVKTDDPAILHCLRALAYYAQGTGRKGTTVLKTGESNWRASKQQVTFRFTDPAFRDRFIKDASRILPTGSWSVSGQSDADPARPIGKPSP